MHNFAPFIAVIAHLNDVLAYVAFVLAVILSWHEYEAVHRNGRVECYYKIVRVLCAASLRSTCLPEGVRVAVNRVRSIAFGSCDCAEFSHDASVEEETANLLGCDRYRWLERFARHVIEQ